MSAITSPARPPLTLLLLLALLLVPAACSPVPAAQPAAVTVGMEATAVNSLIYIAAAQNYFASNGLNVTIKNYPSGLAAVNGMLNHEVDIATAAEFVLVGKAFAGEQVVTFGTIDKFLHIYLIGRQDHGITRVADLEGKRIGVPLKTAAEFYLGRFLDLHGMNIRDVTLVDVPADKAVDALVGGAVDAVITWRPNVNTIEDRLGAGLVMWHAQSQQVAYCSAITTSAWARAHPELVQRFLKALVQAERYNASYPEAARTIVQQKLNYDNAYMRTVWLEHQLAVSLDQSLILAMEDESRWMIHNGLSTQQSVPDFLQYIQLDSLQAIKPESANVIR